MGKNGLNLSYLMRPSPIFDKKEKYEDIKETLKKYKGILSNECYDYLIAILNLETSALSDDISEEYRNLLSELDIYKKLIVYNIYNRTNKLLQKNKEFGNLIIDDKIYEEAIIPSHKLSAISIINNKQIDIFNFDYDYSVFQSQFPCNSELNLWPKKKETWSKKKEIGVINLYLTIENQELREQQILRLLNAYELESNKKNPYDSYGYYGYSSMIGGPGSIWEMEHFEQLSRINEKFKELDGRKSISDLDKQIIEIQQYYYNLILENMEIDKDAFENVKTEAKFMDSHMVNNMNMKKIKKYPNLDVYLNIKNL